MNIKERGMTLIEVLVSMMLLSLGLVGLLSLQMKGAVTIRESGIVGYAPVVVDSLIEAMRTDPTLKIKTTSDGSFAESIVIKDWSNYEGSWENGTGSCAKDLSKDIKFETQKGFAQQQICSAVANFEKNVPPNTKFKLKICPQENSNNASWPTYTNISCSGGGTDVMVKIAWTSTKLDEEESANLKLDDENLSSGYQAIVERRLK